MSAPLRGRVFGAVLGEALRRGDYAAALSVIADNAERTEDGCWLWPGTIKDTGYGTFRGSAAATGTWRAHRLTYWLATGDLPKTETVHHRCSVIACVNPEHLELATNRENTAEMFARKAFEARIAELEEIAWALASEHLPPSALVA